MSYIPEFDQEAFNDFVIQNGGEDAVNDPAHVHALSDFLISFVTNLGFRPDVFLSASEDAQGIAAAAHEKWVAVQGGLENNFDSKKAVLIDTTVTNGDAFVTAVEVHRENGITIVAAIGFLDRNMVGPAQRTVGQVLATKEVPYYALTSLTTLLGKARKV